MSSPLVSVCIVTFNHEKYIRDCVMSVIEQANDVDIEILIGDDQSTDETRGIMESLAEEYPDLVNYRRNPVRLGPAGNYQSLIAAARGSLIAHLDGDDYWFSGKLAAQVGALRRHGTCSAVYTNAMTVNDAGETVGLFNNPQPERISVDGLLARGNFLCHSSVLYRANIKDEILAMLPPFVDYRIHILCALRGDLAYLNEALVAYRINSTGSVLIHQNENIRQQYWDALMAIPRDCVSENALAGGITEFGRSVFFASIKKRDPSLLRSWIPRVLSATPGGRLRAWLLMSLAIVRVGMVETYAAIRSKISAASPRVLYRR
jgi:glycosyltransferase involved in cell wall biosynthesis